jgi:hypothetical protein
MRNLAMNDALGRGVDPVACSRAMTQPRIFAMLTTGDLVRHACAILGAEPRHRGSDPAGRTSPVSNRRGDRRQHLRVGVSVVR